MITAFTALLAKSFIGPKFAKAAAFGIIGLAVVLLAFGLWTCIKGNIISEHDMKQDAKVVAKTNKSTGKAIEERSSDTNRLDKERSETRKAVDHAKASGRDPRAAYYECVRVQQQARQAGRPTPTCQ